MNKNFDKETKINILFVSDFLPSIGWGASTYTLSILEYLLKENFEISYITTKVSIKSVSNLFLLPSNIRKIVLKSLFRYCIFLLTCPRLWKEYIISFVFFLYSSLPTSIKQKYYSFNIYILKSVNLATNDDDFNLNLVKINPHLPIVAQRETIPLIQKEIQKNCPQIIIANYVWMVYSFEYASSDALKVVITHDVMHERLQLFKKHNLINAEPHLLSWDKKAEAKALSKADLLLAIQDDEARSLKKLDTKSEILTVPMAVKFNPSISEQIQGRCLFIGSQTKHNFYGLNWFLDEVWTKLLKEFPNAELNVCGSVCTWFQNDYKNVNFKGIVPDLSLEYSQAQVCIIPNLMGSGLKIKLIEALSYGKACVSTSVGLQGLMNIANEIVLLGDNPEDFCLAIGELLTNDEKREKIESLAKHYITKNLSPEVVYTPLINRFYQHITKNKDIL
jgi:glycosyltransferase involved in cell wall biosynthesis